MVEVTNRQSQTAKKVEGVRALVAAAVQTGNSSASSHSRGLPRRLALVLFKNVQAVVGCGEVVREEREGQEEV